MLILFPIFAQSIDCGYTLEPPRLADAVLMSTLCFGAKIRKIGIPLHTTASLYIKVGFKGVYITRKCYPDVYAPTHTFCCSFAIRWHKRLHKSNEQKNEALIISTRKHAKYLPLKKLVKNALIQCVLLRSMILWSTMNQTTFEPPHGKTNNLHSRKQRRRSASQ